MVKNGKTYEKIKLTVPQNIFSFPNDALYRFICEGGHLCLDNSYLFVRTKNSSNNLAISKKNFAGFKYVTYDEFPNNVYVVAKFNDETAFIVDSFKQSSFDKHGKERYESIINLEKIIPNQDILNTEDNMLELYSDDTIFLSKEKQKVYSKKI